MRTFKRDNWTNKEVMAFLQDCMLSPEDSQKFANPNFALENAIEVFEDFDRPLDEFGAMGFCVEENQIFHIGPIPPQE